MRIATWNVNGLRARMDFITHWLKSRAPDVVGLQEVKVRDEDFPHDDFRALGYHAVVHGEKGWNGVAVLSRTSAEAETRGLPGRENDGARLLRVRVAGLHFATVYCPNGKTPRPSRLPPEARLVRSVARLPLRPSTGMSRSSSAGISTSCRRRWTAGRGPPPTGRSSAPPRNDPDTGPSSIWGSRTCFVTCTRRSRSSPGGTTGAVPSTAAWGCASTCSWVLLPWFRGCVAWRSIASTARRRTATLRPITRRCSRIWIDQTNNYPTSDGSRVCEKAWPVALLRKSKLAPSASETSICHRPSANDFGRPSSVIRFSTLQESTDSTARPAAVRARRPSPRIDLYREKAFSTRACRW